MTLRQNSIKIELPSCSMVSETGALAKTAQTTLQTQRAPSREEQQVGEKTRLGLAKQIGHAMLGEHAQHLVQIIDERSMERVADFVDFDRALRNKPRDPEDQADIVYVGKLFRQMHVTSIMGIRMETANQIEQVIGDSLEPEDEKQPHYIVEHTPGILGWLTGGQKWTKVLYE